MIKENFLDNKEKQKICSRTRVEQTTYGELFCEDVKRSQLVVQQLMFLFRLFAVCFTIA